MEVSDRVLEFLFALRVKGLSLALKIKSVSTCAHEKHWLLPGCKGRREGPRGSNEEGKGRDIIQAVSVAFLPFSLPLQRPSLNPEFVGARVKQLKRTRRLVSGERNRQGVRDLCELQLKRASASLMWGVGGNRINSGPLVCRLTRFVENLKKYEERVNDI